MKNQNGCKEEERKMRIQSKLAALGLTGLLALGVAGCDDEYKEVITDETGRPVYPVRIIEDTDRDGDPDRTEIIWVGPTQVSYIALRNPTEGEIKQYKTN